jgi:glycosyltransferase involved in cell wall biosynthesis
MTICLCMIVRDEAHVLARCLAAALPLIDRWLIIDTGSTDDTEEIARSWLNELPGEYVKRPWVNFGVNRSELIERARGRADYLLLLDADMEVDVAPSFDRAALSADAYLVRYEGDLDYAQQLVVRGSLPWRYEGSTHEVLTCDGAAGAAVELRGLTMRHHADGGHRAEKFTRDAALLWADAERDPANCRTAFYLAQTLRDLGDHPAALTAYRRRAAMGGWPEEVFYSLYQIAQVLERTGASDGEIDAAYLAAYEADPGRAEPLYRLALRHRLARRYATALMFAEVASAIPYPDRLLFVERDVYEWRIDDELSICLWWTGQRAESVDLCNCLLWGDRLPAGERERVERNRAYGA